MTCCGWVRHRRNSLFPAENDKMTPMTGVLQREEEEEIHIEECVV